MKTSFLPSFAIFVLFLIGPTSGFADPSQNWSHWRGHDGNGVSTTATPPTEWSETKNIKWKVAIPGRGSGSPVIWEDSVFVVSAVSDEAAPSAPPSSSGKGGKGGKKGKGKGGRPGAQLTKLSFQLFCFDRESGELKWNQTAVEAVPHEGTHQTNGFASASPCTDGERVYAHFGSRGLFCYDMNGVLQWSRTDFGKMETRATFGEGSSPTLVGEMILVPWDHEGPSALYALDKKSGETIWKTDRDEPTCWATPLVVSSDDGKRQVIMNGQNKARAYDLETGEELWRCGGQTQRPVASPVHTNGITLIGSGFRGEFMGAFKLDGRGDIEGTKHVVWTTGDDTPDIASPMLSEGRIYYHKGKSGILSCLNAETGEIHFGPERIPGVTSTYASPIAAGGHVYLTDRGGAITVIKDAPTLEIVATNSLGEGIDASPAPVGNQLFIRGASHLFCIAE
ncbi:MAG: PQQ-binding-like beta-propeller repeat protein [Verrucomicrobiota bacterium]